MLELEKVLVERLRNTERLAILGVGCFVDADAAAGLIVAANLKNRFEEAGYENIKVLIGGTEPEKCVKEISEFKPEHLLVIDTADVLREPGSITVILPDIMMGVSYTRHMLMLRIIVEYLKKEMKCGITILGIQPAYAAVGEGITEKVRESIETVSEIIGDVVAELGLAE